MFSAKLSAVVYGCLLWSVSAAVPQQAYLPAYATVDESTFYVQGGSNVSQPNIIYDQFYSLDLTKSWNDTNPPWSAVPAVGLMPPRLKTWAHSISVSSNNKTLTFWDMFKSPSYSINYHLETNSWEELPGLTALQPSGFKMAKAATDPTTDRVYIPGGVGNSMLVFDASSKNSTTIADPPGPNNTSWNAYTFVWSNLRRSFLLFGGLTSPESSYFYEYTPTAANPWNALNTTGIVPPMLAGSCMVSAHSGTKMLLFGGMHNGNYSDNLYILDVATMKWSLGAKYQPRSGAACSVSGDYFIVWGGTASDNVGNPILVPETPGIYNINATQWTTTFIAKVRPTPTPTPTPTPKPTTTTARPTKTGSSGVESPVTEASPSDSNKAAIIGGSVGGGLFLILMVLGGLCFWRRRRNSTQQQQAKEMQEEPAAKKFQFRIVQQPETESALEPTFYPSRPFRITPSNSQKKPSKKSVEEQDDDLSYYFHSHGGAPSPTQSVESFSSSPSTSTLDNDIHPTNITNTTLLPQHIITLKPSERQRYR
ncbi:hypothetical protein BG015_005866 [Linnemannia schmuckeri]|uniref:Galactose oxidase n=1 Tax=Linnemannia schmuckeri TaxID=64567 RepID=A0A9P5S0A1_9FUNG|nr:hypothetical protein BG015_005866 [Linnemannia schmuckeri]